MTNPAADRVPSWPNLAIVCLLFTPALMAMILPFMPEQPAELRAPEEGPDAAPSSLWLWVSCLGCVAATLPLAARLSYAPHVATAILVAVRFLGPGRPLGWITFAGIALAWVGRASFTRDFDPAQLPGWALQGYRRLLRPDRWAALRVIAGVILLVGGVVFMMASGTAISASTGIPVTKPLAKILAIPAFLGAFLAASGLSFTEESRPPSP